MPKPKTVSHVVDKVDRVEDLPSRPENIKKAEVSGVIYKRHRSYDGGTYWAAEDVKIPESAINEDVIIGPGVKLSAHIEIGMGSTIGAGTKIGPGSVIGKGVNIGENCDIGKKVVIGEGVQIDDNVTIKKGSIDDENGPRIGDRAHIFEYTTVEGDVEEEGRVGPEKRYRKIDPEADALRKEFEEDYLTTYSEQEKYNLIKSVKRKRK